MAAMRMSLCEAMLEGAEAYWVLGDHLTLVATTEQTGGKYFAVLIQSPFRETDRAWFYPHTHGAEQTYLVLEGRLGFEMDGREGVLEAGDRLVIAPGVRHRTWNAGPGVYRAIMMMSAPGGEAFYRRFGRRVDLREPTEFPTFTKFGYDAFMEASRAWMLEHNGVLTTFTREISAALPTYDELFGRVDRGHEQLDENAPHDAVRDGLCSSTGAAVPASFLERAMAAAARGAGGLEAVDVFGDDVTIVASTRDTSGKLLVTEVIAATSSHMCAPTHVHDRESQYYLVLEGAIVYRRTLANGTVEEKELGAGESVYFPAGMPHRVHNKAGVRARMLVVSSPSGLESIIREAGTPRDDAPKDPILQASMPVAELLALVERHNRRGVGDALMRE